MTKETPAGRGPGMVRVNLTLSAKQQTRLLAGFLFAEAGGPIQDPVRRTRVRLLGRIAQEDVDEGDARRARTRDGPSQSHPLRQTTNPPPGGFFVCQKGCVRGNCRKAASGFDKNAGRPLLRIPALRGTGASTHNAFLHEGSEPEGQGI